MRRRSDPWFVVACVAAVTPSPAAWAAPRASSIEGRIRAYECGDNCYLTIIDRSNRSHTGLCTARACEPWNRVSAMPARFVNRRVVVTVGRGVQRDAAGTVMGQTLAFRDIRFVD